MSNGQLVERGSKEAISDSINKENNGEEVKMK